MAVNPSSRRVSVLVPLALPEPYDYAVPLGMSVELGSYVVVPLGAQRLIGVVWGEASGTFDPKRLKSILEVLEPAPMTAGLRQFIDWMASYTLNARGSVLRLALRSPAAFEPAKMRVAYRLTDVRPQRMTPARMRVVEHVGDEFLRTIREIADETGVSDGVVRGLVEAGTLAPVEMPADADFLPIEFDAHGKPLSDEQQRAADMLRAGKQALILLPEIALTSQFLSRFEARFGVKPAEWHSELSTRERARVWRGVSEGRARVVVGARSALFLPFAELGLIVVDEEHEAAFKQDEGVNYHARDMAVVRASLGGFPIILSSATPSLETVVNVEQGRYERVALTERHGVAELPHIEAIDMRQDPPERGQWLAPKLVAEIAKAYAAGEQSMLFLNRRGYAPLTLCRTCGHRIECPQCSAWLVEHRFRKELVCHHCGYTSAIPKNCPSCQAENSLVACGPGVERIAEEVAERFPEARVALLSSDALRGPQSHEDAFAAVEAREVDIIIGTQIVAKGHHFPWLTVVGVVDADLGLENGDLRAAERTFQLLQQVAGRAGRAERKGRVYLQTYMPEHSVMRALIAGDRDAFLAREAEARERVKLPPFGRLAGVVVSSENAALATSFAREMARAAPLGEDVAVLGPAPAPLAMLRGRTRLRFLVKAGRQINIQAYMEAWLSPLKVPGAVRVSVDIDPYSFL